MVWKKVSNSDAGDSTHFGGDDVDKISETFNAGTQTDPINIKDENLLIVDPADTSKKVRFDAGGVTTSTTRVVTLPDGDITVASTTAATTSVAGLMSAADKTKLDAIEASATADQTNAQIVAAVEAGTDSNTFTDADHTKLNNIEASADVTDTANVNAAAATAVGTITSGTWQGTTVAVDQGGTGVTTSTGTGSTVLSASPALTGTATGVNLTLSGDLTVNGTTTTINSTTLTVDDKNIEMGSVASPTDITADGGGITLKGDTDKTINWVNSTDSWTFNQAVDVSGNNIDNVQNLVHDFSTATTTLDFAGDELQEITISADTTFAASSNIAIGRSKTVIITTDSTLRALAFPSGWKFIGSKPTDQAASKVGVLTLTCRTGIESGIICSYGVEE